MSKKPAAKTAPEAKDGAEAPKKRSKLKLALIALLPVVLAGGGYGGWIGYSKYFAPPAEAAHGEAAADGEHAPAPDPVEVSAVPTEIAAETSFTHSYAISILIAPSCGSAGQVDALKAASDEEARADGMLASLSWQAAARRTVDLTQKSCSYMRSEVIAAENKAAGIADSRMKIEQGGGAEGGHH